MLGRDSLYIHTLELIEGLVSNEEKMTMSLKRFFPLKIHCLSSEKYFFGTEHSDSCLIISFILQSVNTLYKYLLNTCYLLGIVIDAWDSSPSEANKDAFPRAHDILSLISVLGWTNKII